jgi:hypothetical protein
VLPPCEGGRPSQGGGYRDEDKEENMAQWLSSTNIIRTWAQGLWYLLVFIGPSTDKILNVRRLHK